MPHTTVNSGFFSGGVKESTPLDGAEGHGARLVRAPAPVEHAPEVPEEKTELLTEVPDTSDTPPVPDRVRRRTRAGKESR